MVTVVKTSSLTFLSPPAPTGAEPAEEVRPCRTEGQAAHAETLRARSHSRSQKGCADPTPGAEILLLFFLIEHLKELVLANNYVA